jgi:hypothetical protein
LTIKESVDILAELVVCGFRSIPLAKAQHSPRIKAILEEAKPDTLELLRNGGFRATWYVSSKDYLILTLDKYGSGHFVSEVKDHNFYVGGQHVNQRMMPFLRYWLWKIGKGEFVKVPIQEEVPIAQSWDAFNRMQKEKVWK